MKFHFIYIYIHLISDYLFSCYFQNLRQETNKKKNNSMKIMGPLASTKEHQKDTADPGQDFPGKPPHNPRPD